MRILLVSQMYPGPADPDLGIFVKQMEDALAARGHVLERVDLERFSVHPAPPGPTAYLSIGGLTPRKNVRRLADAFASLDDGTLTFVGDGPLRRDLEGRERVHLRGTVSHEEIPALLAEAHV